MGTLIMPIGISACGKSSFKKELLKKNPKIKTACPDNIRRSLTGNVSDQSANKEVFNIINHQINDYLSSNEIVYFDATNLTEKSRKSSLEIVKKTNSKLIVVIFLTSYRYDICEDRCRRDLNNLVDRSNTLTRDDKGNTVIYNQYVKFCNQMRNIESAKKQFEEADPNYQIIFRECEKS